MESAGTLVAVGVIVAVRALELLRPMTGVPHTLRKTVHRRYSVFRI